VRKKENFLNFTILISSPAIGQPKTAVIRSLISIKDGGTIMARMKKHPSKAGVSAASVKGNAGPSMGQGGEGKVNSQNSQYKK
jgi:hypothetical protein